MKKIFKDTQKSFKHFKINFKEIVQNKNLSPTSIAAFIYGLETDMRLLEEFFRQYQHR